MTTVPPLKTFVDAPDRASILIYAEWNAALFDSVSLMLNPPMVQLQHTTAISVPNTTWTALPFQTEVIDTESIHSLTTNPSRVTPKTPGWYIGHFGMSWATNTAGKRHAVPRKNGTLNNATTYGRVDWLPTSSGAVNRGFRFFMPFNGTTDYVEVAVFQSSGAALSTFAASTQDYAELTMRWWKTL